MTGVLFFLERSEEKDVRDTSMRLSHANPGTEYRVKRSNSYYRLEVVMRSGISSDNVHTRNRRPRDDHDHDDDDDDGGDDYTR